MYEGSLGRIDRVRRSSARPLGSKTPIRHLDGVLMLAAFALTAFGNVMVYSASRSRLVADGFPSRYLLNRQIAFSLAGLIALIATATFSYRRFKAWGPLAYVAGLSALFLVMSPLGSSAAGAQRWINFGFFQFQPSEFMKIAVLVVLALFLSERKGNPEIPEVISVIGLVLLPGLLIYLQPDLGTLLVLLAVTIASLVVSGTRPRLLFTLLLLGVVAIVIVLQAGLLKDYQVARLTGFLDPHADVQRTGYNLNQARIGIGSGQIMGKGLFSGSQTNLDFVPEVHTDFIFVALGEELGFVGALGLLGLFALYIWRGIRIALLSKDLFGTLLASGVVAMIAFQMFVNIGMTIGVSPITGIPLPFVSYGGSSMITTYIATGILLNVHMRRVV